MFRGLFNKVTQLFTGRTRLDEALYDELEETLIESDVGVHTPHPPMNWNGRTVETKLDGMLPSAPSIISLPAESAHRNETTESSITARRRNTRRSTVWFSANAKVVSRGA